jgi:small multidrug resistance pump
MREVIIVIGCAIIGSIAQILLKLGMASFSLDNLFSNWKIASGLGLYALAMVLYLYSLRTLPLSIAYPLIALSYIFVAIGSAWFVGEQFSAWSLAGSLLILIGISFISLR